MANDDTSNNDSLDPERRYAIGEVAELLDLPPYLLRQWEKRFPEIRPRRTRTDRRYYLAKDIDKIRRIKNLLYNDGMNGKGVRVLLAEERHAGKRPRTHQEVQELADKMAEEARAILEILGPDIDDAPAESEAVAEDNIQVLFPRPAK